MMGYTMLAQASKRAPPKGGKFFYMDFAEESYNGQYLASMLLGTEAYPHKMYVSTSQYSVGLFSSECGDC